jgi:hypothetical protein
MIARPALGQPAANALCAARNRRAAEAVAIRSALSTKP